MIYFGITIGPIIDTLLLTSSPAGLWCSSYMFSEMSYNICKKLEEAKFTIYSPYFGNARVKPNGVGAYHDRIIFSHERNTEDYENVKNILEYIIEHVKDEIVDKIDSNKTEEEKDALKSYFSIQYLSLKEENILNGNMISVISPYLDSIELSRKISTGQGKMELKKFLDSENLVGRNEMIKNSEFIQNIEKSNSNLQLFNEEGHIKSLGEIASSSFKFNEQKANDEELSEKTEAYVAIIQADGDNIGKLLGRINDTVKIQDFSKLCMEYSWEASEIIHDFGGVTIYAGGDDLLFLTPLKKEKNANEKNQSLATVIDLCNALNDLFNKKLKGFDGLDGEMSMSFGINIFYYKSPLYEALQKATCLLFAEAKNEKNTKAIQLTKHSGQTIFFTTKNGDQKESIISDLINMGENDEKINSILYHLHEFEHLFNLAFNQPKTDAIEGFFQNIFDDYQNDTALSNFGGQQFHSNYVEKIQSLAKELKAQQNNTMINPVKELTSMLRFIKFFSEGGSRS